MTAKITIVITHDAVTVDGVSGKRLTYARLIA
jgi:hypothetical protein